MPFSVGDGELRIVPSVASKDGLPLLFHWHWYYHVPSLSLWALILLLLVAPKANRDRQAWLILIPLVVILLVWRMPFRLLAASDATTETFGFFVVTGSMTWSMVWLLGHWLGNRPRYAVFFLALAVMLAAGLLSYSSYFGTIGFSDSITTFVCYGVCCAVLLLSMLRAGRLCREDCTAGRFCALLFLWIVLTTLGLMLLFAIIPLSFAILMTNGPQVSLFQLLLPLVFVAYASLFLTVTLYLVNLPFVILAFKSPFYRARLKEMFHFEEDRSECNERLEEETA